MSVLKLNLAGSLLPELLNVGCDARQAVDAVDNAILLYDIRAALQ